MGCNKPSGLWGPANCPKHDGGIPGQEEHLIFDLSANQNRVPSRGHRVKNSTNLQPFYCGSYQVKTVPITSLGRYVWSPLCVCVCVCSLHTAVYLHETSVACCDKACWGTSTLRRHRCSDQAIWRMSTVNASPVQTAKKYTKREKNTYVQWICSLHLRLWNTPLPWRLYHFCLHTSAKKLIEYSWNCRNIKWWYSSPKEHFVTTCHFQCIPKVHIKSSVSMTYLGHVPEAFRSHRCDTGPFIFLTGDRCETAGECQSGTQQSEPVLPDWKQNRQDNEESGFLIENIYTS